MVKYLAMMMIISFVFLIKSGTEENLEKKSRAMGLFEKL